MRLIARYLWVTRDTSHVKNQNFRIPLGTNDRIKQHTAYCSISNVQYASIQTFEHFCTATLSKQAAAIVHWAAVKVLGPLLEFCVQDVKVVLWKRWRRLDTVWNQIVYKARLSE